MAAYNTFFMEKYEEFQYFLVERGVLSVGTNNLHFLGYIIKK